jgi:hypothetical protein
VEASAGTRLKGVNLSEDPRFFADEPESSTPESVIAAFVDTALDQLIAGVQEPAEIHVIRLTEGLYKVTIRWHGGGEAPETFQTNGRDAERIGDSPQ